MYKPKQHKPTLHERLLKKRGYIENNTKKRLIVVLEDCYLETAKVDGRHKLLNSDDHHALLNKHGKDPANYRPDILHQCLLQLQDSPLNKAGLLEIYIRTHNNVLIKVNPQCRIPRTFKRFCGLMVQLLHKLKIKATEGNVVLLKVVKNPITNHLPAGCKKIGTSCQGKLVKLSEYVPSITKTEEPVVFVIGGIAHGNINIDYVDETISISNYPLSAAVCCTKICSAFEDAWKIL